MCEPACSGLVAQLVKQSCYCHGFKAWFKLVLFLHPCPRYPAVLLKFHLNKGTGGEGVYRGGEGVVRETLFRRPLTLSVLTERRVFNPYGLKGVSFCLSVCLAVCVGDGPPHFTGGSDGKKGRNILISAVDKTERDLGPKSSVHMEPGVSDNLCSHDNSPYVTIVPIFLQSHFSSGHISSGDPWWWGIWGPKNEICSRTPCQQETASLCCKRQSGYLQTDPRISLTMDLAVLLLVL